MPIPAALRFPAMMMAALALGGCDPRDCWLGIAHRDCGTEGSGLAAFPQDDAICRNDALAPGTRDYAICRQKKKQVRALTEGATDFGFLQNPLAPDVRVVTPTPQ